MRHWTQLKKKVWRIRLDAVHIYMLQIPKEFAQYAVGFGDGDGCIKLTKNGGVAVTFVQASNSGPPAVLRAIQTAYGGTIGLSKRGDGAEVRDVSCMYESASSACLVLRVLYRAKSRSIMYAFGPQIQSWCKYFMRAKRSTDARKRHKRIQQGRRLKLKNEYQKIVIDQDKVAPAYVAGLFDAEGCAFQESGVNLCVTVAQTIDTNILRAINEAFGDENSVYANQAAFHGFKALRFLQIIRPYCIAKADQIDLVLKTLVPRGKKRYLHIVGDADDYCRELKRLKKL